MSPTWVRYREKYRNTSDGDVVTDYDRAFTGFFGNCRALIGIQVPVSEKLKIGSEAVFSFFNGMELQADGVKDEGFRFPTMKWEITARYGLY